MAEPIEPQAEFRQVPQARSANKVHARIALRSRLRRRSLQLQIFDYYYLSVRMNDAHPQAAEYVLDLRFVDRSVRASRQIASRWLLATLAFIGLAFAIGSRVSASSAPRDWLMLCVLVSAVALGAALVCLYRTTETVALQSAHGRATLLEFTSGLGSIRALKPFMRKLAAHITLAVGARRRAVTQHLRDEILEHFRLRTTGVLSEEEFETSKGRILAEHLRAAVQHHALAAP